MEAYHAKGREWVLGRASNSVKVKVPAAEPYPEIYPGFGAGINSFLATRQRMPKRYKRRQNRRRRRRIYRRRPPSTLQPYSIVRKLKTAFHMALDPNGAAMANVHFKLNSAFDPTGDVGAGQPLGFDQYNTLYQKYCVTKTSLHFKAVCTDNTNPVIIGFTPKTDSTDLATYLHYLECPGTVSRHLTPDIDKIEFGSKVRIKPYLLPRGGKLLTDDTTNALYSADPSRILYGHFWTQATDTTVNPSTIQIVVIMYQTVVFYDPIIPSRS